MISLPKSPEYWRFTFIFETQRMTSVCMWRNSAVTLLCQLFVLQSVKQHLRSQGVGRLLSLPASQLGSAAGPAQRGICCAKSKAAVGYILCPFRVTVCFSGQSTATVTYPGCLAKSDGCPSVLSFFHICFPSQSTTSEPLILRHLRISQQSIWILFHTGSWLCYSIHFTFITPL